ncbi:MAG: HAMP domain-containing sensor histidine kinase [Planctomycetota bacterium]
MRDSDQPRSGGRSATSADLDRVVGALERAEVRLRDMQRQLDQAERLATMGTLVGVVAHEFNNLLTPIMSYAQLAMSSPDDAELTRKALDRAYHGAERASRVAASMLGFGKGVDEPDACLVERAVEDAIDTARLNARHERIELTIDVEPGLCAGISPLSLQQILVNLLLNARKAIGQQPGAIRISAACSTWNTDSQTADACVVRVSDTGPGVPAELLDTLFTPYRSGSTTASGTGLGLTICKRLVEAVGGTIEVGTGDEGGASFTVTMPMGDPALLENGGPRISAA